MFQELNSHIYVGEKNKCHDDIDDNDDKSEVFHGFLKLDNVQAAQNFVEDNDMIILEEFFVTKNIEFARVGSKSMVLNLEGESIMVNFGGIGKYIH